MESVYSAVRTDPLYKADYVSSLKRLLSLTNISVSLPSSVPAVNPIPARSKAWVCGRSPVDIVGSNPAEDLDVCFESCVLTGRGLCDELITRPEESYRLWCVMVFDLETS